MIYEMIHGQEWQGMVTVHGREGGHRRLTGFPLVSHGIFIDFLRCFPAFYGISDMFIGVQMDYICL